MRKSIRVVLCVAFVSLLSLSARAGIILQDVSNNHIQVNFFEPVAQSFTAEDPSIKFAFHFFAINPQVANSDPLRLRLLSGDGLAGAELASNAFNLLDAYDGFFDVDFSAVSLTVGQSYTAVLDVVGNSPFWGVRVVGSNLYAGGRAYWNDPNGFLSNPVISETRFRVTPVGNAVPEPGVLALVLLAMLAGAVARTRRS